MIREIANALHLPKFTGHARPAATDQFQSSTPTAPDPRPWNQQQAPAVLLGQSLDGKMTLGNVRWGFNEDGWKATYRDTTIDPSKVKNVYVCLERFPPEFIAAHSFLYFDFGDDQAVQSKNGESDNGLCVSMEARTREGQNFDLIKGMENQFGSIYQVSTWKDTVQKTCRWMKHPIERYPLALSQEQKEKLLQFSLHEALVDRSQEHYNTLNNSCFTNVERQLNSVLPWYNKIGEWLIPNRVHNPVTSIPVNAGLILDAHRLLPPNAVVTITEPHGRVDHKPAWADAKQIERWWKPFLKTAGAATLGALGALLPGNIVTAGLGIGLGRMVGDEMAHSMLRTAETVYESADVYPVPAQQSLQPGY